MSEVYEAPSPDEQKQRRRSPGAILDVLLIVGAIAGIKVMFFAWLGMEHDKKWAEARRILIATHAEIEHRLIEDRQEWEANQRRRIRQLEAERPDGSDSEEMRQWREDRQAAQDATYDYNVLHVLGFRNGDQVLAGVQWEDAPLRYFRRGHFLFFAGGNRPSEESGHAYFIEVVGEPLDDGDEMPEGVLRIYSDGSFEGPLPLAEATPN